jgi:biotin carboxylase/2-polyprenyl-3-methyl-5-hydroxy-6-metoxy-1,4-benzoquinol methylase
MHNVKQLIKRKCPLCGNDNFSTLKINEPIEKVGHNVICNECGLIYHNPVMTTDDMAEYYTSAFSEEYHESETMQKTTAETRFTLLKKYVDTAEISPVLEIGCAYGDFLKKLREEDITAEGIEPSEMLAQIGSEAHGITIVTGTYETLPENRNKYGMIVMSHVLEHFSDPVAILQKARRELKENGLLYLIVPTLEDTQLALVFKIIHPTVFVRETLEVMVKKAGFSVVKVVENGYNLSLIARKAAAETPAYPDASLILKRINSYLDERGQVLENIMRKLDALRGKSGIAIYGAGHNTIDLNECFPLSQLEIEGIYDADPAKQGNSLLGHVIQPPEALQAFKGNVIIISSYQYQEAIEEQLSYLKERGVSLVTLYNKNKLSLLLYPAGIAQEEAFIEAKRQGLKIVTVDENPDAPLKPLADEFHHVNPADEGTFLKFIREYKHNNTLDGVLIVGCDLPVSCAIAGKELGTPAISPVAASLTVDKIAMKERLRECDVAVPDFFAVCSGTEVRQIVEGFGSKMVIKPNDNCGARGVMQLHPGDDYDAAFNYAKVNTKKDGKVILEKFIKGVQISIEGLAYGNVTVTSFADRNYEHIDHLSPYIIENGATMPTELSAEKKDAVIQEFIKGVKALGIDNSVAKGDMVMGKDGPVVIEIAGRISGGKFATKMVPESTGVNLLEAAISLAVGKSPEIKKLKPLFERGVAVRYMFPPKGILVSIDGVEEARAMSGILELVTVANPDEEVGLISCHADRGGWVVAVGKTRTEAVRNAEKAIKTVVFNVR